MAVITNTTSAAWPVSDGVTDGKWAVLSLDCAFSWVGEVFFGTQIGRDCCPSFCWDCLGELGFWCRQPERSDTNLMLWFIERVYLWVGRCFPEINRIFLFSVILGGCEGQLLDQGNSSWDLEESWTSPTQSIFHGSKHRAWWGWLWTHESLKYEKPLVGKAVSTFDSGLFFQTFVPALSWDSDKFKSIIEPVVWQRVAPKIAWGDPWGFWALLQAE